MFKDFIVKMLGLYMAKRLRTHYNKYELKCMIISEIKKNSC